jgi:hypothetical protein
MTYLRLAATFVAAVGLVFIAPGRALADNGNAPTTMSFFSGGQGAHADWFITADQPPGDTDRQAVRLQTTNGAPTYAHGYAGILFHHVTGIPAAEFPNSYFWNKTPYPYLFEPYTQGSPRLVVAFQNALGQFDGYGALRENTRLNGWDKVADGNFLPNGTYGTYPNSAWDVMSGPAPCVYVYNVNWQDVQTCFADDTVLSAYIVADAYGVYHLIDDMFVNGKHFSSASDNGNGKNDSAGPDATTDPDLLPPVAALLAAYTPPS